MRRLPVIGAERPLCPSAQPDMPGSVLLGVMTGTANEPRLRFAKAVQPVTPDLLALSDPVRPAEVFRFAAPCAEGACAHFDGTDCRLGRKAARLLPEAVEKLPPCPIRPRCRWWQQEGKAACARCPQVVTEAFEATREMQIACDPSSDGLER